MKKLVVLFLMGFLQFSALAQPVYRIVKISPDIQLIKISENAWVHISWSEVSGYGRTPANGLIFVQGKEAMVFDSPWNDALTKDLFSWITDSMKLKITGFVPNHWHSDCMGGLKFIQSQKIKSYANSMTIDLAKSKKLPVPDHGFKDSLQLKLGDKLICCYYLGAAHSMDNIVVWIPSEKILFPGCMVKSMEARDLGNTADGDLTAYHETIEKLTIKFPEAKIVVPGHGPFGGLELIRHTKELTSKK